MNDDSLDRMIALSVETLTQGDEDRIGGLVRLLATRWPNEPALSIAFALTNAAASIEEMVDSETTPPVVLMRAYKFAALVAADVHAVQSMGKVPARASDLLHFWRRVDPWFLNR
jgi:hypothetical protein